MWLSLWPRLWLSRHRRHGKPSCLRVCCRRALLVTSGPTHRLHTVVVQLPSLGGICWWSSFVVGWDSPALVVFPLLHAFVSPSSLLIFLILRRRTSPSILSSFPPPSLRVFSSFVSSFPPPLPPHWRKRITTNYGPSLYFGHSSFHNEQLIQPNYLNMIY